MYIPTFISKPLDDARDVDNYRQRLFLLIAAIVGSPTLLWFAVIAWQEGQLTVALLAAAGPMLLPVTLLYLSRPGWMPRLILFYFSFLILLNLLTEGMGIALLWTLIVPVTALFAFGTREGLAWSLLFSLVLAGTVAILVSRGESTSYQLAEFTLAYVTMTALAFGYEVLRQKAQAEADQRTQRLQRYVGASSDWLFELDSNLRITYLSPRWQEVTGIPVDEIVGTTLADHVTSYFGDDAEDALKSLDEHRSFHGYRYSFTGADGRQLYISGRGLPHFSSDGKFLGYTGTGTDITAYEESRQTIKQTEHQLAQSQKMVSVGQLVSGIAHDFNNLLTVIMGHVDLIRAGKTNDPRMLDALAQAAERASQLTRRLLSFSRQQVTTTETVDVNTLLRDMTTLLTRTLGARIALHLQIKEEQLFTSANLAQFENAILNLAINARDAMDGVGNLTVASQKAKLRSHDANGDYVLVRVIDDGCGIAPELMDKIKEPFFTTKPEGRGSGLGLTMVSNFVAHCGGVMAIDSEAGAGTTVSMYFPVSEDPGLAGTDGLKAMPSNRPMDILIVEDNDEVAQVIATILERDGNTPRFATSAEIALASLENSVPDLVIADVELSGNLTGVELMHQVRRTHPEISLLLITGYPEGLAGEVPDIEILMKPFSRTQLLLAVERAGLRGAGATERRRTSDTTA